MLITILIICLAVLNGYLFFNPLSENIPDWIRFFMHLLLVGAVLVCL